MVNSIESNISAEAEVLYTLLGKALGEYVQGLEDLGYELIEGGDNPEVYEDWSAFCHPDCISIVDKLNLDLSLMTEDDFSDTIENYYKINKKEYLPNMLLPNPKSATFQGWNIISDLD
jgi:hypothetical protein